MPEIRHYTVRQVREVKVHANSAVDAARIAAAAFEHGHLGATTSVAAGKSPDGVWGNTMSRIREIDLHVTEERYGKS